jgi:two-component system CheB/CheR fusion protein
VLFLDCGPIGADEDIDEDAAGPLGAVELRRLRDELRAAQERLSASRREHESASQELRIANEELQTVNSELKSKLDNISHAHSDLQNLVNATEIGTLFLDAELRIRMLTPSVEQLFNVTDSDLGRPLTDFTHKLKYDAVEKDARKVLRDLAPVEDEVETSDGRWLMMRLRPYRTVEDRIEGVVLSFVEITERRTVERALRESEASCRVLLQQRDAAALKHAADKRAFEKERDQLLATLGRG